MAYKGISLKSRKTALLLNIFLGCVGVDAFYLGHPAIGVIHILIYIFTHIWFFAGIMKTISICVFIGNWIWAFVGFMKIVTGHAKDGKGRIVKYWDPGLLKDKVIDYIPEKRKWWQRRKKVSETEVEQ